MIFTILNRDYEIVPMPEHELEDTLGRITDFTIEINDTLPPHVWYSTLLHEIIHSISHNFGVFEDGEVGGEAERETRTLTAGLIDAITKNRDIFQEIIDSL